MSGLEIGGDRGLEKLVGLFNAMFGELTPQEKTTLWADNVLEDYNSLPKKNSRERKLAENLVTKTAAKLLENPQDISIAWTAWGRSEAGQDNQESEPFSKLVKDRCLVLIRDKWEDVMPEQLAQMVRISSNNNDPVQDYAKEMLKNYFKGPNSSNKRIDAYYNFVSATLDLVGEDNAFKEGMKIALHGTDILPKDPSLREQAILLSLPYNEEESVFKKVLTANYVIIQLRFMGFQDLDKYYQDRRDFIQREAAVIEAYHRKEERVASAIGNDRTRELNDKMLTFFAAITKPISSERKQSLKGTWPYNLAFDGTDPLNQKFQKAFADKISSVDSLRV